MKSYEQHCAVAKALDVIGDRWSLLIVRELLLGQERWGELRDGLPGIAKNLLAERLRALEAAGVIDHEGDRYRLTPDGHRLEGAVHALAAWGAPRLLDTTTEEDPGTVRARWVRIAAAAHPEATLVQLDEDRAVVRLGDATLDGTPTAVMRALAAAAPRG